MGEHTGFHEDVSLLSQETKERHRAIVSLMEELEAVDWYDQRIDATQDEDLKKILIHNRDEEKEHAVMTLEWLRRRDPQLDEELRNVLFKEGSITPDVTGSAKHDHGHGGESAGSAPPSDGSLGIGSLKGVSR